MQDIFILLLHDDLDLNSAPPILRIALDTQATQAVGAGKYHLLPHLFQRTVMFLLAHCLPIAGCMMLVPSALRILSGDVKCAGMRKCGIIKQIGLICPASSAYQI